VKAGQSANLVPGLKLEQAHAALVASATTSGRETVRGQPGDAFHAEPQPMAAAAAVAASAIATTAPTIGRRCGESQGIDQKAGAGIVFCHCVCVLDEDKANHVSFQRTRSASISLTMHTSPKVEMVEICGQPR
jgi:hypothetical protein